MILTWESVLPEFLGSPLDSFSIDASNIALPRRKENSFDWILRD